MKLSEDEATTERVTPLSKFIEKVHDTIRAEGGNFIIYELDFLYIGEEVIKLESSLAEVEAQLESYNKYCEDGQAHEGPQFWTDRIECMERSLAEARGKYLMNADEVREVFMEFIKDFKTQKEMAYSLGIDDGTLSKFINGEIGPGQSILDYLGMELLRRYKYKEPVLHPTKE